MLIYWHDLIFPGLLIITGAIFYAVVIRKANRTTLLGNGWELRDGILYGPNGERLRAISGGQEETALLDLASSAGDASQAFPGEGGDIVSGVGSFTPPPSSSSFGDFASGAVNSVGRAGADSWKWLTEGSKGGQPTSDSPLADFTKLLGLGATGFGIANQFNVAGQVGQQTKQLQQSQKNAQNAAAPAVAFGTDTLNAAAGGNLTPSLQSGIDQWVQKAKADAASRFASMGLGNSSSLQSFYDLIDQQAQAMKGQMLQQQEETGLAGIQTGVSADTSVMGSSSNQQNMLAQLIQQANQALGQMSGRA